MKRIWFFNEKTVYDGRSIVDFNSVRNVLELHKIPYKYKTVDLGHNTYMGTQGVTRSVGADFTDIRTSLIYEVLVNKKDYDEAMYVLSNYLRLKKG